VIGYVQPFYQKLKAIGFIANAIDIVAIVPFGNRPVDFPAKMKFETEKKKFKDLDYEFCKLLEGKAEKQETVQQTKYTRTVQFKRSFV